MQRIINDINSAGKTAILAKPPVKQPLNSSGDLRVQAINSVIDELVADPANNIPVSGPDFHSYFAAHLNEYADPLPSERSRLPVHGDSVVAGVASVTAKMRSFLLARVARFTIPVLLAGCDSRLSSEIPYDHTNPIISDNDSSEDAYTDELLMALHTAGRIDLRGMITTFGGWSEQGFTNRFLAAHGTSARHELVGKARRSGMTRVPWPVAGSMGELATPASGRMEDTVPHRNAATDLIIAEAHRATPEKPLVVVVGGPCTTVAEAFLLDPGIKDRVIVAWNGGNNWNGEAKPFLWATEIVLRNLKCVLFDLVNQSTSPDVDKSSLSRLPDTELRRIMIEKELPHVNLPGGRDYDASPAFPLITTNYVNGVRRCRWSGRDKNGLPVIKQDASGNLWRVVRASSKAATAAWWDTMTNAASWSNAPAASHHPFADKPFSIPGRIEAEQFDDGGPGVAYFDVDRKNGSQAKMQDITAFRVLEHVDFGVADDTEPGYAVIRTEAGEWLDYTVNVKNAGAFQISARIASSKDGGAFHISFDGKDATDSVAVPSTSGLQSWQTMHIDQVQLSEGAHTMRVHMRHGGFSLNWLEFAEARP